MKFCLQNTTKDEIFKFLSGFTIFEISIKLFDSKLYISNCIFNKQIINKINRIQKT